MAEEEPNRGAQQRLRWWQEDKPVTAPIGGVGVRVQASAEESAAILPDIGLELEEEALHRSLVAARGERVEIYANPKQNNQRTLKRVAIVGAIVALYIGIAAAALRTPALLFSLPFFALEIAVLFLLMKRFNAKQTRPIVTLTREGIEIYSLWQELGLIRWAEIDQIRAYTQIYRYVGIVPKDMKSLCARMTKKQSRLIRMNEFCRLQIYRPLRVFIAPINLAQQVLPITADELVKQIETFRANNGI